MAAVLSWVIPRGVQRLYAIFASFCIFALTLYQSAEVVFSKTTATLVEHKLAWLPELGVSLNLRLDSVSVWFVVLNALVAVVAFSLKGSWYRKYPRLFTSLGFFLVSCLNGAFLSTDLVFFYLAYEAVFIPMIFMVGIWGEKAKALAVFRFFLMSFLGSVLMLVSIFYLIHLYHDQTGNYSSNLFDLMQVTVGKNAQSFKWAFLGFFLAFAIKVPLFPFHGWLKEVYVLAPMPATIWMSAILSKLGVYGFVRFVTPLFMETAQLYQGELLALSAISIIYAAFLAIRTQDAKTLLAYSSVSHLGFVLLGVFALNPGGSASAVLLSIGHTLVSALLFYVLHLIQERQLDVGLEKKHGLAKIYPVLFVVFFIGVLASVSLPGTVNFVGEFLVLLHAYPSSVFSTVFAGLGVILGAVYMLKFYQQVGLGKLNSMPNAEDTKAASKDLGGYDLLIALAIIALIVYFGFQPAIFLKGN